MGHGSWDPLHSPFLPAPALYQPLLHPKGMQWLYLHGQAGTGVQGHGAGG